MKITLTAAGVEIDDKQCSRSLTLEQYERHARDPEFVKAIAPGEHAKVLAARADELELEAQARAEAEAEHERLLELARGAAEAERERLAKALADPGAGRK